MGFRDSGLTAWSGAGQPSEEVPSMMLPCFLVASFPQVVRTIVFGGMHDSKTTAYRKLHGS